MSPITYGLWNNRGVALHDLERYEEAIASFNRALEIKPDLPGAWTNKGLALADLGRCEQAIASCTMAIKLQPDLWEAWYNRACICVTFGRVADALTDLQQAIIRNPECQASAAADADFDAIREHSTFQDLIALSPAEINALKTNILLEETLSHPKN